MTIYAGTALLSTGTFTNTANVPTDPSSVTLKYGFTGASVVTISQGSLTHVGTGVWSYIIDTTDWIGQLITEWIGTGSCAAVNAVTTQISDPPI